DNGTLLVLNREHQPPLKPRLQITALRHVEQSGGLHHFPTERFELAPEGITLRCEAQPEFRRELRRDCTRREILPRRSPGFRRQLLTEQPPRDLMHLDQRALALCVLA